VFFIFLFIAEFFLTGNHEIQELIQTKML